MSPGPADQTPPRPRHARRGWLGYALVSLVLSTVAIAVIDGVRGFLDEAAAIERHHRIIAAIESIHYTVRVAEAEQRLSLLLEQRDAMERLQGHALRVRDALSRLRVLVAGDRARNQTLDTVEALIENRIERAGEILAIEREHGLEAARRALRAGEGAALAQQAESLLESMRKDESRHLADSQRRSERAGTLLPGVTVGGIAMSLALVAIMLWAIGREARIRLAAEQASRQGAERLAESLRNLEANARNLKRLSGYAGMLQSCRNLDEALELSHSTLPALAPGAAGSLYLLRASRNYAEKTMSWGRHAAVSSQLVPQEDCWSLRLGQTYSLDSVHGGNKCPHVDLPPPSKPARTACIPMTAQGQPLGFLYLNAAGEGAIADLSLIEAAADQLSLALFNLRLQESLRNQSIRDPLTGLYNRRYLDESLDRELARCRRRAQPLTVLMLDIDRFKTFNDSFGHDAGDRVLEAFGALLKRSARAEDIACRYGGEEFTLILPETDREAGLARAEEIRLATAAMRVEHLGRPLPAISVSIGTATVSGRTESGETLLRLADAALYQAKEGGRNRVEAA